MAVATSDKKLNGAGLATVWSLAKSLYNAFVTRNEVKILGQITNMPPNNSFAQHSLIGVDQEVFINESAITGVPNHVVTHGNAVVSHNGKPVTHGANTTTTWKKIV